MATISENLEALKTAKTNIKTAIENKGQDLTDVPFTQYGEKIADIQTKEDLDTELNEQDTLLAELESSVEGLPEKEVDLSETTATADDVLVGKEFYNASGEKVAGTYKDMLQARVDTTNSCEYLFYGYGGDNVDFIKNLDVSQVIKMDEMFKSSYQLKSIPALNSVSATSMYHLCYGCSALESVEGLETGNVTEIRNAFWGCAKLVDLPLLDLKNAKTVASMFNGCSSLTEINITECSASNWYGAFKDCTNLTTINGVLNFANCTANYADVVKSCTNLTTVTFKNINVPLQIGSGTSWGHLLTLDSLLNTVQELWTNTSGTKTLTIGTANTAKLADVYVKLIDITDEMRAEDEYIDNKAPFEVCESTDDGAMLITEYVTTIKKWQLA